MSTSQIMKFKTTLVLLAATVFMTACLERRTTGTVLDDQNIEYRVISALFSSDGLGEESHIKVEVYESVVLLMGETDSEEHRKHAGTLAAEVDHVKRVVNEVQVMDKANFGDKFNNSWLTTKVNTSLTTNNPIDGFDATRIKVITSRHTVYLMGQVSREEGDAVAEVARNVLGVEKVVKVFSYTD